MKEIKINKGGIVIVLALLILPIFLSFSVYSQTTKSYDFNSVQYTSPTFYDLYPKDSSGKINYEELWPILSNQDKCENSGSDFIVSVRPGGCSPAVVRSDLLEEQNVPVFCKLDAIKLNPLIDVAAVKSVSFSGNYPKEISGISFHPSLAALRLRTKVLDSPLVNDIGYVVIILKRVNSEKDIKGWVSANLTATLRYDTDRVYGIGNSKFYLPVMSDEEWQNNYKKYGFWKGKGYVRVLYTDKDSAEIAIYKDKDSILRKMTLKKGATSSYVFIPGFFCDAGVSVKLNDLNSGKARARLIIDGNSVEIIEGQKIIDNNCEVVQIKDTGNSKLVSLRCKGKTVDLRLYNIKRVTLKKGNNIERNVGELVERTKTDENIYLVYVGEENKQLFSVLAKGIPEDKISGGKVKSEILDGISLKYDSWKRDCAKSKSSDGVKTCIVGKIKDYLGVIKAEGVVNDSKAGIFDYELVGKAGIDDVSITPEQKTNFEAARASVDDLVKLYGNEKDNSQEFYGAMALSELAETAEKLKLFKTEKEILEKLTSSYGDSPLARQAQAKLDVINNYFMEEASANLNFDSGSYYVILDEVIKPGIEEASAVFDIRATVAETTSPESEKNGQKVVLVGEYIYDGIAKVNSVDKEVYAVLKSLDDDEAEIEMQYIKDVAASSQTTKQLVTETKKIKRGEVFSIGNKKISLDKITLQRTAEVDLIAKVPRGESKANFSVKIGIEKRAIKLNPDKTLERISNINQSIKKWENILTKLGNVVKGLKGACLITSTGLIVKNFFTNLGGRSDARQIAMRSSGGWVDKCNTLMSQNPGKYASLDACLYDNRNDINKDIDALEGSIKKTNDDLKGINSKYTTSTGMFGSEFDGKKAGEDYRKNVFLPYLEANKNKQITMSDNTQKSLGEVFSDDGNNLDEKTKTMYKNGDLTVQEMRDIVTYGRAGDSGATQAITDSRLAPIIKPLEEERRLSEQKSVFKGITPVVPYQKGQTARVVDIKTGADLKKNSWTQIDDNKEYVAVVIPGIAKGANPDDIYGKSFLAEVKQTGDGKYAPTGQYYEVKDGNLAKLEDNDNKKQKINDYMAGAGIASFEKWSPQACANIYQNPDVKYYENEPYKGMPAVVPVDTKNGWYAATKQVLPGFGLKSYTQAGSVSSFWLCNVGKNGREDWQASVSDDIPCTQINLDTGQPVDQLPCLDEGQARRLVATAKRVIEQAASQYGSKNINLDLASGRQSFKSKPAFNTPQTQCSDFMDVEDCHILFNVCDPVICPSSRCNFGGKFPVDDVIQSGIIGSLLLCMPNFVGFGGDVYMPVCLSGLHAGLDAYVQILKSHRDCLQEAVNTGKYIGICDEIYSIYLCEFFWRQAAPLMDYALPKLIEYAYTGGQNKGGGEYTTVQNAWENSQKSVRYITDYYGANSFKAFKARSTAEVGTEVCKAFLSSTYPNAFNNILEPDSPVQFYGRFDEIPFNDATVPSTSQYKVYYHIYAGKDQGNYFTVYLKNPPESGYYSSQPYIVVDSGYAGTGQTVDQTKDFTAPAGYKELCIRIGTKDECGFKQVTTSFALDYLQDSYLKEQGTETITSEKDCVVGSVSAYPLLSPNIQEGVAQASTLQGGIYQRGLVRVCSTNSPGEATDPERWKTVGYCDKSKGIKCWLDSRSVRNSIQDLGLEQETITKAQENMNQIETRGTFTEEDTNSKLDSVNTALNGPNAIDKEDLLKTLKEVKEKGFFNTQKAKAYYLELKVYIRVIKDSLKSAVNSASTSKNPASEGDSADCSKQCSLTGLHFKFQDNSELNLHGQSPVSISPSIRSIQIVYSYCSSPPQISFTINKERSLGGFFPETTTSVLGYTELFSKNLITFQLTSPNTYSLDFADQDSLAALNSLKGQSPILEIKCNNCDSNCGNTVKTLKINK